MDGRYLGEGKVYPEAEKILTLTVTWSSLEAAALQDSPYLGPTGASFPARFRDAQCPPQTT